MQINYAEYDVNGKKLTVRKDGASLTVMVKDPETGKCVADYFTSRDVHFDDTASEVYLVASPRSASHAGTGTSSTRESTSMGAVRPDETSTPTGA